MESEWNGVIKEVDKIVKTQNTMANMQQKKFRNSMNEKFEKLNIMLQKSSDDMNKKMEEMNKKIDEKDKKMDEINKKTDDRLDEVNKNQMNS